METSEGQGRRQRGKVRYAGGMRLSICSGFQQGLTRSATWDTVSCRCASAFPSLDPYLSQWPWCHWYERITPRTMNQTTASQGRVCFGVPWQLSFCFGHLFFSSPFLSPYAVEQWACAIVVEITWSERYRGGGRKKENAGLSEVSVRDWNWNHWATLKWKTVTQSPLAETQHFTTHITSALRFYYSPPTLLLREQLLLSELSVFCCSFLLVIALEESPDRSSVISTRSRRHKWRFVWGMEHLPGGICGFIEQSPLMRLHVENKQERDQARCAACQDAGCWRGAPPSRHLISCVYL